MVSIPLSRGSVESQLELPKARERRPRASQAILINIGAHPHLEQLSLQLRILRTKTRDKHGATTARPPISEAGARLSGLEIKHVHFKVNTAFSR